MTEWRVSGLCIALTLLGACNSGDSPNVSAEVPSADGADAGEKSCASTHNSGVVEIMLTAGGATHAVRIYYPPAEQGVVLPTVLNWHGNAATGNDQAAYTEYEALAEQEGFIVVHPTGSDLPGLPVLESGLGWELVGDLDHPERDDIAFAGALIDELIANWCADSNRIYSIGLSNGALFTSTLVCAMADRLAGVGSVAGIYHPDSCEPSQNVPYVAFHGVDDPLIPFETGGPTLFTELSDSVLRLGAIDAFAEFAADAGCDPAPAVAEIGTDVTRYDYLNCEDDTPMTFYAFRNVPDGHTWPGSSLLGETSHDIDATRDSWLFFEPLSLDQR